MTTIAVTGHMNLTEATVELVRNEIRRLLSEIEGEVIGVSCIAKGSDTIFAEEVLKVGGKLVVIIPSRDYRERKVKPDHAEDFDRLVEAASEVVTLEHETANRQAYASANDELLKRADKLFAVWDGGEPGAGGGTADTVVDAKMVGVDVEIVWPDRAKRA